MRQKTELLEDLCTDEAVCFIAGRHKVTSRQLLDDFLLGMAARIPLEPNEIEILRDLSGTGTSEKRPGTTK